MTISQSRESGLNIVCVCVKFVCYSFYLSQRVAMDLTEKLHYAIESVIFLHPILMVYLHMKYLLDLKEIHMIWKMKNHMDIIL